MRWERVKAKTKSGEDAGAIKSPGRKGGGLGPGKRWGHTCNTVRNGRAVYVFGGYGKDNCQTNDVHVFDTNKQIWTKPILKGRSPSPRDSHSCTTVGTCLFVFGGTDGRSPLRDLVILDTATNTWVEPEVHGEGPAAREGHSAALIGQNLFIFGGCGKTDNAEEIYYNDLYMLDTIKFTWTRPVTSGKPPPPRDSHTCSVWNNKIIVLGGEDASDSYLSDVYVLDADTLVWGQLPTGGQNLTARAGHCTVPLGKYLFVFGGFTDDRSLYDDLHILNIESGVWTKAVTNGTGPSARFAVAGDCLDYKRGILVFIGGCNENLEALDDLYYLHTEMVIENVVEEQKPEKLSFRKELKRKRQEHHVSVNIVGRDRFTPTSDGIRSPPLLTPPGVTSTGSEKFSLYDFKAVEEKIFEAKITDVFPYGYTIESYIDGKHLRGLLFSYKPGFANAVCDYLSRKHMASEEKTGKLKDPHTSKHKVSRTIKQFVKEDGQSHIPMDEELPEQVIGEPVASPSNQSATLHSISIQSDSKLGTGLVFANASHQMPTGFQKSALFSSTPPVQCDAKTGSNFANAFRMPTIFQQSAPLSFVPPVQHDPNTNTALGFANALHQIQTSFQESAPLTSTSTPPVQCNPKPENQSECANPVCKIPSSFQSRLAEGNSEADIESGFTSALHSTKENVSMEPCTILGICATPSSTSLSITQCQSSSADQGGHSTEDNVDRVEKNGEVSAK